jgi:acrylyl-CoA reductase (NADPH)
MRAIRVRRAEDGPNAVALVEIEPTAVADGEVSILAEYSSLNYKDALALAGRPGIVRGAELTAGIDVVGVVHDSRDARWNAGDRVIVTGRGLGETRDGGLAGRVVVPADLPVRIPDPFTARQAAAIGTAGFTAALCVGALAATGSLDGADVAVSGAGGGVGSIGIRLLHEAGARVFAITGRSELGDALIELGADVVLPRAEFEGAPRMLEAARWDAVLDAVGGGILASLIAQTKPGGVVAACGNAAGMDLVTSVAPFILRGVSLIGVNSVHPEPAARDAAWGRLAADLDPTILDSLTEVIGLDDAIGAAERVLAGGVHGRIVVDVRG